MTKILLCAESLKGPFCNCSLQSVTKCFTTRGQHLTARVEMFPDVCCCFIAAVGLPLGHCVPYAAPPRGGTRRPRFSPHFIVIALVNFGRF